MYSSLSETQKTIVRALAVLGVIGILTLLAVLLGRAFRDGFSWQTLFSRGAPTITLTIEPQEVPNGGTFHLAWTRKRIAAASYGLTFTCPDGISIQRANSTDALCNQKIPVSPDQFLIFNGFNSVRDPIDATASITAERAGDEPIAVSDAVVIRLLGNPRGRPVPPNPTTPSNPPNPPTGTPTPGTPVPPASPPDLSIRILGVGLTTVGATQFTPAASVRKSDIAGVRFLVENSGGRASGPWRFISDIPVTPFKYTSPIQQSIPAGGSMELTLGFSGMTTTGNLPVKIVTQLSGSTDNQSNNTGVASVSVTE